MRQFLAAMTLVLAGTAPAFAQQSGPICNISAYVIDRDTAGLNVRAGPSAQSRVLRTISNQGAAVVEIRSHSGSWFRVSRIVDAEDETVLFTGDGWVHSSLIAIDVANGDPRLYAAPARRSRALARLVADQTHVTLIGCSGDWVRVRAGRREGWLSRAGWCSSPLTTCV